MLKHGNGSKRVEREQQCQEQQQEVDLHKGCRSSWRSLLLLPLLLLVVVGIVARV
jgi:hypothetical protein